MNEHNQCFCPNCGTQLTLSAPQAKQENTSIREIPLHTRKGTSRLGFRHVWTDEDEAEQEENEPVGAEGIPFVSQLKSTAKAFYGHKAICSEIRYFSNGADKQEPQVKKTTYERNPQHAINFKFEWLLPIGVGGAVAWLTDAVIWLLDLSMQPYQFVSISIGTGFVIGGWVYREIQKRVTGEKVTTEYHEPKPTPDVIQKVEVTEHVAKLQVQHNKHSFHWFEMEMPIPVEKTRAIARHLENGGSFSRTSISDTARIISGYKFRELTKVLKGRDMAYTTKDKKTHLKAIGKKLFKSYLESENIPVSA